MILGAPCNVVGHVDYAPSVCGHDELQSDQLTEPPTKRQRYRCV